MSILPNDDKQLKKRQVFYLGSRVFFKNFFYLVAPYLIVSVPFSFLLTSVGNDIVRKDITNIAEIFHTLILMLTYATINLIFQTFLILIIIHITHYSVTAARIDFMSILKATLYKWGKAFWAQLLSALIITGLTFLLIIPGLIWWVYYTFVLQVVAFTGLKGKKALNYSKNIVKERMGDVFIILLIMAVPIMIITMLSRTIDSKYIIVLSRAFVAAVFVYSTVCFTVYFENLNKLYKSKET